MIVESQLSWFLRYMRDVRELATLRAHVLRLVAVSASMTDGTGIRAVRNGAYTARDMTMLAQVMPVDLPGPITKRMAKLESNVIPWTREDAQSIDALNRRFAQ